MECDKVGGEHWQYGYCGDCENIESQRNRGKNKNHVRLNHYDNLIKYKKNGVRYACKSKYSDYYYDRTNYFNSIKKDEFGKLYSQRIYVSGRRKYSKKQTNKKLRKSDIGNYGAYRKVFDYWSTIF